MKNLLLWGLLSLALVACGGAQPVEGETFETTDASYELGEHVGADGKLVIIELIEDGATSYLTPMTPNSSWIVDRAVAHSQQRPLLLNEVKPLGLYVRRCQGGHWINANETAFAPASDLLQTTYEGEYVLSHYYANIQENVLLDGAFECARDDEPELVTVTIDGEERAVQRVGVVSFAYVVEHRE